MYFAQVQDFKLTTELSEKVQYSRNQAIKPGKQLTAPFNNMRTLKFKAQPTNAFFAAVNQVFGGCSQLTTTAEPYSLSELCTTI